MPWHPPIPFGALYSEDAIKLGPALSLLGYCYDKVNRDDRMLRLNLHTAAGDMGVPYPTVKRWWESLRQTGYIAAYQERGRNGLDVRMSDDWLDWWREETRSQLILNSRETGRKRDVNGTEAVSEMIPNGSAYKVLNNTDQARGGKDRDGTAHPPPAVTLLFEIFGSVEISAEQTDDICSTVTDLALWREVLVTWRANGYKPRPGNLLDRYLKETKAERSGQTHRNGRGQYTPPTPEWTGWTEVDTDKPL